MKKTLWIIIGIVVVLGAATFLFIRWGKGSASVNNTQGGAIKIVAAEDFYGNIAQQLGGDKVSVTSILSDPNVDPHEYESDVQDGIAITNANIVIENGLEYDTWMDKLLSASPNPNRILITAGAIAPDPLPENPHVWYGIDNISAIAGAIESALVKTDPADAALFQNNLAAFNASLAPLTAKMNEIKAQYAGTPVDLTETIYLYQTGPMGLDVLTPFNFEKAIAEGNDPSAQDVNTTDQQIANKQVKVLIYNSQTVTPITTNLENAALANGIPVVPVTETMPPSDTYQTWMMAELDSLQTALAQSH
ncbi:MAG TPA: zinc ABC transporter substrate-binding protein [Candidatus Paceibacterota bacterium]|nr:zinc ABC transporter substrate-binding protein [Candidatus Paceibacterota bacterium]